MSGVRVSWTCCPRSATSFEPQTLSRREYVSIVKTAQYPLYFLLICQAGLVVAWQLTSFVPGFCPLVHASSFHAVCHTGFWLAIEIVTLLVGFFAPTFGLWEGHYETPPETSGKWQDTGTTRAWLVAWIVLLFIALCSNVVHLAASLVEYYYACTTTLCLNEAGYLFSFLWILGFCALVDVVLITRVLVYRQDLYLVNRAVFVPTTERATKVVVAPAKEAMADAAARLGHRLKN